MPRIRRVNNGKYNDFEDIREDNQFIDSSEQEDLINKFNKDLPFSRRRKALTENDRKLIKLAKIIQVIFVFINLLLIIIPYYRKGLNAFISFLSTFSFLFSTVNIQLQFVNFNNAEPSTVRVLIDKHIIPIMDKYNIDSSGLVRINLILSVAIMVLKFLMRVLLNPSNTVTTLDLIYLLPILISTGIYITVNDIKVIDSEIEELENLKYDYKEA
ncbi:unnamed protein product [[Candida] boidinii]|uniref:Unnamed protein product n=1 Tax=Candida boidinii TaxID=5477 RepID=A0A9W6STI6_CANBO|nr:hypothetical protein BVG19_g4175 [[Candida] boidinii]OWB53062.1 hypothetical protein B5S27_g4649 [[Candida] boidinii]OWB68151.1 hypothetical protein B5S30_g3524 [[Candida] boidinii]OWB85236.1 hypothetical protein B5S33_g3896 [[Candida] boidinii]GME66956.1 unnamed protein product [[Candida] boidinii]